MTALGTPRERVEAYLNTVPEGAKWASVLEPAHPLVRKDLEAILAANRRYEDLMREAGKEAVREYKAGLAAELRGRIEATASDRRFYPYMDGQADTLESIADDLENDSL